jgi:serine phosphatase RsbU (regulator of sigma subunit)
MNLHGEQFGEQRLEGVIRNHAAETAAEIVEAIVDAVAAHTESAEQMDDMTILAMKRTA